MGTRDKLFRQKLANQIESLLTQSEKVFSSEKLSNEWLEDMLKGTQELTSALTIYQFLHELPEDENLQIEFLEMAEKEKEAEKEPEIPNFGDEIMKEIDEFDTQMAVDIEAVEEVSEEKEVEIENIPVQEKEEIKITPETETIPVQAELEKEVEEDVAPEPEVVAESKPENEDKPAEINDLVANPEASLAEKLSRKSIGKLADSIALNERFLYSNELFNGNMEAFKRALTELDHIASLDDARRYIEVQLKSENDWEMDSKIVQGFISLVERRFN